jgi:N-acetylmuramoyl-L-alanine amidase
MFKLALGAGHFFNTAGKRCLKSLDPNETREWWLNDRIADKVEALLAGYYGVSILRLDDSDDGMDDIALEPRVNRANEWKADFYLSIHHNAGVNGGKGGGIVSFCHPKAGAETVEWRDELYEALIEHTGLLGNRSTPKATADHYVTRNTTMPAVLLELGFMDSATDVPIILTEEYADSCAKAIVEVIVRRAGLVKKNAKDEPDAWAKAAWEKAKAAGVMDGTRPRDTMTRQELAQVLANLKLT